MSSSSVKRPMEDRKVFSSASSDIKADRYRICSRLSHTFLIAPCTNIVLARYSPFTVSIRLAQLRYDLTSLGLIEAFPVRFLRHCSRIKRLGSLNPKVHIYRLSTHNHPRLKLRF